MDAARVLAPALPSSHSHRGSPGRPASLQRPTHPHHGASASSSSPRAVPARPQTIPLTPPDPSHRVAPGNEETHLSPTIQHQATPVNMDNLAAGLEAVQLAPPVPKAKGTCTNTSSPNTLSCALTVALARSLVCHRPRVRAWPGRRPGLPRGRQHRRGRSRARVPHRHLDQRRAQVHPQVE